MVLTETFWPQVSARRQYLVEKDYAVARSGVYTQRKAKAEME